MNCLICERIQLIKEKRNPYFVKELSTGYVVLGDSQYFYGYTVFLSKEHVLELHQHSNSDIYLREMKKIGEAVYKTFRPKKLNYEILGNSDPHLHTHIFPRYETDILPKKPVWVVEKELRESKKLSIEESSKLTRLLNENIKI